MPGVINKIATVVLSRLLPKRTAVSILARSTKSLADVKETKSA